MSTLTLGMDSSRDLYLDRFGNIVTKTDENAMADFLTQRLSNLVGELRYDKTRGIPYMTTVFATGKAGIPAMRASMLDAVKNSEHILGISYLYLTYDEANLRFELSAATDYGQVALKG